MTSYDGKYISLSSSDPDEPYAVIYLAATGEVIQKIPDARHIVWSPADKRFAVELSGTALNSRLSYITHMENLEAVMKKTLEKLGGRTLSDEERKKYWLR